MSVSVFLSTGLTGGGGADEAVKGFTGGGADKALRSATGSANARAGALGGGSAMLLGSFRLKVTYITGYLGGSIVGRNSGYRKNCIIYFEE